MAGIYVPAVLLPHVPDRDIMAARAAAVRADAGFAVARDRFCAGVAACFARRAPMARAVTDTGSYAIFAALMAGELTGPTTIGGLVDLLGPSLASERRIRRTLATLEQQDLVMIAADGQDRRRRLVALTGTSREFLVRWYGAYTAPLADLAAGMPVIPASPGGAAAWKFLVARMFGQHGVTLTDSHPAVAALMAKRGGYLALLSATVEPDVSAHALARRFPRSLTQMRVLLPAVRALDPSRIDGWFATELGFAALVNDAVASAGLTGPGGCPMALGEIAKGDTHEVGQ